MESVVGINLTQVCAGISSSRQAYASVLALPSLTQSTFGVKVVLHAHGVSLAICRSWSMFTFFVIAKDFAGPASSGFGGSPAPCPICMRHSQCKASGLHAVKHNWTKTFHYPRRFKQVAVSSAGIVCDTDACCDQPSQVCFELGQGKGDGSCGQMADSQLGGVKLGCRVLG